MNKASDLNVTLNKIEQENSDSVFPQDISEGDLLEFLKFSTEQAADEVFWMKSDSEIFYVNNAACQKLGYDRKELIGMRVWEWDPLFPKEVWPTFWQELKEKKHVDFETQHQSKNGKIFPVRIKGHFLKHGKEEILFAYVSDISDIKDQESKLQDRSQQLESLVEQRSAELQQEKRKFEEFVNLAPVGIAINSIDDGAFTYINSEFSRFTGYSVEELNTMDYWELTPKKYEKQEHEQLESMSKTGRYGPYQKEYIHKEGHTYPVLLSGIKITDLDGKDYIWSVVLDISESIKKDLIIEETNKKLGLMTAGSQDGFWHWFDTSKDEVVWSDKFFTLLGFEPQEFAPSFSKFQSMLHPDDLQMTLDAVNHAIESHEAFDIEYRIAHKNGEYSWFRGRGTPYYKENGDFVEMAGSIADVSFSKGLEEDLRQSNIELEETKNNALELAKVKSQFLANMSHEIRTPMNGIVGLTNLLLDTTLDETQKEWTQGVKTSADSLLTIINDILDISKIESGKLSIESIEFDLSEILHQIAQPLHLAAKQKKIALRIKADQLRDKEFIGDPVRIKQVITNLVNNAIKFTELGSVSLQIEQTNTTDNESTLLFSVTDTGIGIPKGAIDSLFQRFSQADSSTTRRFGGTGLGLNICKQLIELMGGEIGCESQIGEGSRFWFSLCLQKVIRSHDSQNLSTSQFDAANFAKKLKVLLVEDVKINQIVAQNIFEAMGMIVDIAENGIEAIEKINKNEYDLVFMDCHMPEMDGFEATSMIRAMPEYKDLPIIALTAGAMQEELERCISCGMNLVITKPFEPSDIMDALSTVKLNQN